MIGFTGNIEEKTAVNTYFRQVIYTSEHMQLVLMCLLPKEDIGEEVHETTDQFFRIEEGEGKVIIAGEERSIQDGDAVIVPSGTKHNVMNTSPDKELKLYTIYSPPHHKDGTVHKTKAVALADTSDHL